MLAKSKFIQQLCMYKDDFAYTSKMMVWDSYPLWETASSLYYTYFSCEFRERKF